MSQGDGHEALSHTKAHICATCGKQYQRSTHLRRHEATHNNAGRFTCTYCEKQFSRADVYKKHIISCSAKNNVALSASDQALSRRPKACEACFYSKASCDRRNPCTRCLSRNLICRAREIEASERDKPIKSSPASTPGASDDKTVLLAQILSNIALEDMPYLARVMDPKRSNMLDYFRENNNDDSINEDIPESDATVSSSKQSPMQMAAVASMFPSNYAWMVDNVIYDAHAFDMDISMPTVADTSPVPALTDDGFALLEAKSRFIVHDLYNLHQTLISSTEAITYNFNFDMADAESALCAENLRTFMAAFLRTGHPHMPIVHYPTFGDTETSHILVIALVIGGAFRSPEHSEALAVRKYFRIVEEYIYREIDRVMVASPMSIPPSLDALQALQAGIVSLAMMVTPNNVSSRMRARSMRLPKLINAVRHFGLASMRYGPELDWYDFIYNETCIRVATTTAIMSWQHATMFYYPSAVSLSEMKCNFPCARELWNAKDSTAYRIQRDTLIPIHLAANLDMTKSLDAFLKVLLADDWIMPMNLPVGALTMECLFVVITAISGMCVSSGQMATARISAPPIVRSIERWQQLWDYVSSLVPLPALKKLGMLRHCPETALIAKTMIETAASGTEHPYLDNIGHVRLDEFYSLITLTAVRKRQARSGHG